LTDPSSPLSNKGKRNTLLHISDIEKAAVALGKKEEEYPLGGRQTSSILKKTSTIDERKV